MQGFGFTSGLLLGLASSLHCVGMCGGISLALTLPRGGQMGRGGGGAAVALPAVLATHGGRILSYAMLGALVGALGGGVLAGLDVEVGHRLLRWGAGLTLGWMGMVILGLAPAPVFVERALRVLLAPVARRVPVGGGTIAPVMKGLAWGLMPCGMVYGALLAALFAGSAWGGIVTMLGFGLGTLPVLVALNGGAAHLSALAAGRGRLVLGAALLLLGTGSVLLPEAGIAALCRSVLPG